jgi:diguanylate cyclase (GGDEF)-like protein/PAS domain S-box-containing protein
MSCDAFSFRAGIAARSKVMVVNDEKVVCRVFRDALERVGCLVEEAGNGEDAVRLFGESPPDLVILDLMIPGMDGFAACRALRRMDEGKTVPILMVTGLKDPTAIHDAYDAGATDFITKPVNGDLLAYRTLFHLRAGRAFQDLACNEKELRLLRTAVESLPFGLTISDPKGKIVYVSPADARMHGYRVEELLGQDARILAPLRLHNPSPAKGPETYGVWRRESVNVRKDGEEFPVQVSSVAVRDTDGKFCGVVSSCEDISERRKCEARIRQLAYFDELTGLPNRTLFQDRLRIAISMAARQNRSVALFFLALENFKGVNATHGHGFGDRVLQQVTQRLHSSLREADTLARFEGDEFVIIQLAEESKETATTTAHQILETFQRPLEVDGRGIDVGISIGIAFYPEDAQTLENLLRSAELAMYRTKSRGRQNFQFFAEEMNQQLHEKVALEAALEGDSGNTPLNSQDL